MSVPELSHVPYGRILDLGRIDELSDSSIGQETADPSGFTAETIALYHGLVQLGDQPLVDRVVDTILEKHTELRKWDHQRRYLGSLGTAASLLERETQTLDSVESFTDKYYEHRKIVRGCGKLLIVAKQNRAIDITDMLDFETEIGETVIRKIITPEELRDIFRENWGNSSRGEERVIERERAADVILGLLTHFDNASDLANFINIHLKNISELLKPFREEYQVISLTDTLRAALATGKASLRHIEKGKTDKLESIHRTFWQDYYGSDPVKRANARNKPKSTIDTLASLSARSIGVKGRMTLMKHLIRDKVIPFPTIDDI